MTTLPTPHPTAILHSEKLTQFIRHEISQSSGGHISFSRFMQLALYAPGLGYYSAGTHKFGKNGDFITAPEISPLFAQCIAKQCQQILTSLGGGDILEFGAGSGQFATDLLKELEKLDSLPTHYFILEISAELRHRQQQMLSTHCPHLLPRITWLDALPEAPMNGIIFANEVLDAMPVHCFQINENEIYERCVRWENDRFAWCIQSAPSDLKQPVAKILQECPLSQGYQSEINLMLPAWIKTLANILHKGTILLIDYGYSRSEYYHPERTHGTLMCFYQHYRHTDPLILVGLQDITAHVDFTCIAESAIDAGLTLAGFTSQAAFLIAAGLLDLASSIEPRLSAIEKYQQNQAIKTLTLPSQMGELIKVIGLNKNFELPWMGFSFQDRRRDL